MEYHAKSNNSLTFDVTKGTEMIGKLTYEAWYKFNATMEMADHSSYQIEAKGFWGTTIELKKDDKVLLNFNMNWKGEIVIQTDLTNTETGFVFKQKGLLNGSFILIDQDGTELLVMKPHFKWKTMHYEYQITTSDDFELLSDNKILLLTALHCANYYVSMMASVGA